jgi:fido (protein-threonine AMPylation protein)
MEDIKRYYKDLFAESFNIYDALVRSFLDVKFHTLDINEQFEILIKLRTKYSEHKTYKAYLAEMYAMYRRFDLAHIELKQIPCSELANKLELFLRLSKEHDDVYIREYNSLVAKGIFIIPKPLDFTEDINLETSMGIHNTQKKGLRNISIDTNEIENVLQLKNPTKLAMINIGFFSGLDEDVTSTDIDLLNNTFNVYENFQKMELSISGIRNIHIHVMYKQYVANGTFTSPGIWRNVPVYCEFPNKILFACQTNIGDLMNDFIDRYNQLDQNINIWLLAAWIHYNFIIIHPFLDGNGRVARVISSLPLLKRKLGWINILNDRKHEYYSALDIGSREKTLIPLARVIYEHTMCTRQYIESIPPPTKEQIQLLNKSKDFNQTKQVIVDI